LNLFGKYKLKTFWTFSQTGNMWRFIFGGDKYIVGETRDKGNKKLYLFVIDFTSGKVLHKNFEFEKDNFWITVEGATDKLFYLSRFEKPETLQQKNIIAIDILTGEKIWENEKYSFLFNTDDSVFGLYRGFESIEIAKLDIATGKVKEIIPPEEHIKIFELRNSNEDYVYENSNYPIVYKKEEAGEKISSVLDDICLKNNDVESIEYIQKGSLLIFNYYIKFPTESNKTGSNIYENRLMIYDMNSSEILFEDILNKSTNYCVPDNFFIKKEILFYLKEKNELHCLKIF
jgi:hypothetical protein